MLKETYMSQQNSVFRPCKCTILTLVKRKGKKGNHDVLEALHVLVEVRVYPGFQRLVKETM